MKIFDCIPFFDEKMLLDLRLNILDEYVDKFVIVEQSYTHSGKKKTKNFDINDYNKFRDKIIYFYLEDQPKDLFLIDENNKQHIGLKRINSLKRIEIQYKKLMDGLLNADSEDLVIVGDCDEIPNLTKINFNEIKNDILLFKQKIYYYKFNLLHKNHNWFGNKACKKKNLIDTEWLKYVKNKTFPFWRVDTYFSKKKYTNTKIIENGGWHFTNIKNNKDLYYKLMNFGEHNEFELSGLTQIDLKNLINQRKLYFNHDLDKTHQDKYSANIDLSFEIDQNLPKYLIENKEKYSDWFVDK
jgi:beta-1,4-mannosyl-glycoprotein beta-1,4-N-acetylglucosaminyltransferase